jgi:hypothetical protein
VKIIKDQYGRNKLVQWFDRNYIYGYYRKHGTYKNLPRYREILSNRFYKGYNWIDSIKYGWVKR